MSKLHGNIGNALSAECSFQLKAHVKPDEFALAGALKAFSAIRWPAGRKQVHGLVVKLGFCRFTVLMTALMDLYLKCGSFEDARQLFDELLVRDVVSWTSMVVGYARSGRYWESLSLFHRMVESGTDPNKYSFSGALGACAGLQALRQCRQIHSKVIVSRGFDEDSVLGNSLLNTYCKCGALSCALKLFNLMPQRENVAWNELMWGYLQEEQGEEALKVFASMVSQGVKPDDFTYAICTNACAQLASIRQGAQIHARIVKRGFESDMVTLNTLIDMYAKCGCINSAKRIFHTMPSKDTKLWTTMISALGKSGLVEECLAMSREMQDSNVNPDEITYLAILSACSHGGLVKQGWHYFRSMTEEDCIPPKAEHYACMVDLLCRSGSLTEALEFIQTMEVKPSIPVWIAFLNACRLHGNLKLAEFASRQLLEVDPDDHSNRVILSNMFAAEGSWECTETLREKMRSINMKKQPGCSWIEVKNEVHIFLTAGRLHPEWDGIALTLNRLLACCREEYPCYFH